MPMSDLIVNSDDVKIYQNPGHAGIEKGLIDFTDCLRKKFPTGRLKAMNAHAWTSPKHSYEGDCFSPDLRQVKDLFVSMLPPAQYTLFAWFNILYPGGVINPHDHHNAISSCAYHIRGGSGLLLDFGDHSELLPPTSGRLVVFPPTMMHSVPQPATANRYTLSINAWILKPSTNNRRGP
jgi:hypothetical protein